MGGILLMTIDFISDHRVVIGIPVLLVVYAALAVKIGRMLKTAVAELKN